jgi:hypothetical protein
MDDITVESSVNGVPEPPTPDPIEPVAPADPPPSDGDPGDETVPTPVEAASAAGKTLAAKKGSLQARIDAITKEKYDTQRERDDARLRAETLDRELQTLKAPKAAPPPVPDGRPTVDQFDTYDAYVEALTDWKLERVEAQRTAQDQRARIQQSHAQHAKTFTDRIQQAEALDPEFWSKMSPAVVNLRPSGSLDPGETPTAWTAIADVLFTSDVSPALMTHFSQNDRDLQRLSTLPPNQLFRELGKLEAQYTRPAAASPGPAAGLPISHAAPPIKPVGGAAATSDALEITDDLDVDEHIRRMNAREKRPTRRPGRS